MERRFTPICGLEIEERANKVSRIAGYAAVFYDGTPETQYKIGQNYVERMMPGAFSGVRSESDVMALFNHDPNAILGRTTAGTLKLTTDTKGLRYEIDLPDTELGRSVATAVKRRDLTGSSFSFVVSRNDFTFHDDNGVRVREIKSANLLDVGPVTFPAYGATTVESRTASDFSDALDACNEWERDKLTATRNREIAIMEMRHDWARLSVGPQDNETKVLTM